MATGSATMASTSERVATANSSTSSTISAIELQRTTASNVYDAILQLRPLFLATRGMTSVTSAPDQGIVVIVDHQVLGGVAELRNIAVAITKSVRRLSAADVYQLAGISAPAGGIEVVIGR
jgi:hypothetical protein